MTEPEPFPITPGAPLPRTPKERDKAEAEALAGAIEYARQRDEAERKAARERPYPRRLLRTMSRAVYAPGQPPRNHVEFMTFGGGGLFNDLIMRAWKRDLHEACEREAKAMKDRREANGAAR